MEKYINKIEAQLAAANAKFEQHTECYLRTIKALDEQISAANPAAIIELMDRLEALKCCGNCGKRHQGEHGCEKGEWSRDARVLKCDKWEGI
jgi:hypothetical protein